MDERNGCLYSKTELRRLLSERRKALADKPSRSSSACRACAEMVSGNVMVYAAMGSELDTTELIELLLKRRDVVLYAPFTVGAEIYPRRLKSVGKADNKGNLPENKYFDGCFDKNAQTLLDYCVTPLLGFNETGHRIGYGMGCYDRFFERNRCKKIGLAFECQMQSFSPDFFDVPLDCCVTEKNVVYF